jgi:Tfp pilus assembly protein PilF
MSSRRVRLQEMLAQDPDDPFLRYGLAMDFAGGGEDEAAATQFADLLRMAPDYVPAYLQAGQVLARLGRDDEARAVYRAGVAAAQKAGDAHAAGELQGFLDMLT